MRSGVEKRRHRRRRQFDGTERVTGRIRPGLPIRVVDLSEGGGLIETPARLLPGSTVEVYLESPIWHVRARARVIRCAVGRLTPAAITFLGALQFESPLPVLESFDRTRERRATAPVCAEAREPYGDEVVGVRDES